MASQMSLHRTHAHTYASSSLEYRIIYHCSPTLSSLKPGSLFRCASHTPGLSCPLHLSCKLEECCQKLAPYGVEMQILSQDSKGSLVYVFRPSLLKQYLTNPLVAEYLTTLNYPLESISASIAYLSQRIKQTSFPHEIGFFLGYPVHDVLGFIANQGKDHLFSGYWKVYNHPLHAKRLFKSYRTQTLINLKRYQRGATIEELVAS